jgi:hypothetical protein
MNGPVIAAGASFAVTVLIGFIAGVLIAQRSGQPLWALVGFFVGLGVGAYAAIRLILQGK